MKQISQLNSISEEVRLHILRAAQNSGGSSHLGGSLSLVEILVSLYGKVMNVNPTSVLDSERDRMILSKGHGALALFATLFKFGFMNEHDFDTYMKNGSELIAHPIMNLNRGIESSNGSLGHGLGMATGIAWALKTIGSKAQVFVVMGDGECSEGSIWEAAATAFNYELNNITAVVDCNGFQNDGITSKSTQFPMLFEKWKSFGWEAKLVDGHNFDSLISAFKGTYKLPKVILAKTIKGKGVSFMESNNQWHHNRLTETKYGEALNSIKNAR